MTICHVSLYSTCVFPNANLMHCCRVAEHSPVWGDFENSHSARQLNCTRTSGVRTFVLFLTI